MYIQKTNSGISSFKMLITLFVVLFFGFCASKVAPLYYKNILISSVLESVDTPLGNLNDLSATEIRTALNKGFQVNGIDLNAREIEIIRDIGQTRLSYDYEARTELFANISIVINFETRYPKTK